MVRHSSHATHDRKRSGDPRQLQESLPIDHKYSQQEWDELIERFPPGKPVSGIVAACPVYGVWITLDDLPDVPALLEIIHFAINESVPDNRFEHPRDDPKPSVLPIEFPSWQGRVADANSITSSVVANHVYLSPLARE